MGEVAGRREHEHRSPKKLPPAANRLACPVGVFGAFDENRTDPKAAEAKPAKSSGRQVSRFVDCDQQQSEDVEPEQAQRSAEEVCHDRMIIQRGLRAGQLRREAVEREGAEEIATHAGFDLAQATRGGLDPVEGNGVGQSGELFM